MLLTVSESDQTPIYLQIVNQIRLLVSSGRLQPDEELPSIRALAEKLLVNPNTVARAYRELEQAGIVTKKRTSGSYISAAAVPASAEERLGLLAKKIDGLLADARQLNLSSQEIIDFIRSRTNPTEKVTHHE